MINYFCRIRSYTVPPFLLFKNVWNCPVLLPPLHFLILILASISHYDVFNVSLWIFQIKTWTILMTQPRSSSWFRRLMMSWVIHRSELGAYECIPSLNVKRISQLSSWCKSDCVMYGLLHCGSFPVSAGMITTGRLCWKEEWVETMKTTVLTCCSTSQSPVILAMEMMRRWVCAKE